MVEAVDLVSSGYSLPRLDIPVVYEAVELNTY